MDELAVPPTDPDSLVPTYSDTHRRLLPPEVYTDRAKPCRVTEITAEQIKAFLAEYAKTGRIHISATRCGLSLHIINRLRKEDEEFKALCDSANQTHIDETIIEAHRRATKGFKKPIINMKTGVIMGYERVYSDRLIEKFMDRGDPTFRPGAKPSDFQPPVVIIVPGTAANPDAWAAAGQPNTQVKSNIIEPDGTPSEVPSESS